MGGRQCFEIRRPIQGCRTSFASLAFAASTALAQFPDRTITMVVPFPPGGVADTVARPMAEAMSRDLKQSVVIENKAGAGGAIGMAHAAKAKPDGYTVLMALSSYTVLPEADKVLGRTPQYQLADLKPVARVTADPTVLAVRAESPWKTYAEFIAAARAAPGKITFGSSGNYGTMHMPMAMLALSQGVQMTHVPYTGAGPAIVGLLGGQVDALSTGPASIVQHVKAGKVRVLAHWGEGRLASLPDVPSLKELGVPVEYAQWSGIFVPAGTPEPVVARLREAAKAAANDERVKQVLGTAGSPILYMDAPEFQRYVDADAAKMSDVVKKVGKLE
ncbi:MAG: tripartite tricarboxylate transporter substrate binding protein [Betaproteobacteria bacterium]|nr:tripartite tricarboxylate transporter substrate binding protein [Betaproteobacteria bacterium]